MTKIRVVFVLIPIGYGSKFCTTERKRNMLTVAQFLTDSTECESRVYGCIFTLLSSIIAPFCVCIQTNG